jgi:hypothetical protein
MKAKLISLPIQKRLVLNLCLFSLMAWVIPHPSVTLAAEQAKAQIFEIQNPNLINNSLDFNALVESDPLSQNLKEYLKKHNSPLAQYSSEIIKQPQWQRSLAISWVESNFGRFCPEGSNNCSGIGVAPGHPLWRKYPTKLEWFKDMSKLMETPRYKEKYTTFEKMRGIYVYPGSDNWVRGAKQKYAELMALEKHSEEQKSLAHSQIHNELALAK